MHKAHEITQLFGETFDVVIESSKVGLRKPDPKIFQLALQELQVEPHEVQALAAWAMISSSISYFVCVGSVLGWSGSKSQVSERAGAENNKGCRAFQSSIRTGLSAGAGSNPWSQSTLTPRSSFTILHNICTCKCIMNACWMINDPACALYTFRLGIPSIKTCNVSIYNY